MSLLEGRQVRLRAVEPADTDLLYGWENDTRVWAVSGTTEPFSRYQMERFVAVQQDEGLVRSGQLRLIVERRADSRAVGIVDLFEYDALNRRAGVGILIAAEEDRGQGYAADAVEVLCRYGREGLRLHQLWCGVGAHNEASRRLFLGAGFTLCGTRRDWTWHPAVGYEDELMMQKVLE